MDKHNQRMENSFQKQLSKFYLFGMKKKELRNKGH